MGVINVIISQLFTCPTSPLRPPAYPCTQTIAQRRGASNLQGCDAGKAALGHLASPLHVAGETTTLERSLPAQAVDVRSSQSVILAASRGAVSTLTRSM